SLTHSVSIAGADRTVTGRSLRLSFLALCTISDRSPVSPPPLEGYFDSICAPHDQKCCTDRSHDPRAYVRFADNFLRMLRIAQIPSAPGVCTLTLSHGILRMHWFCLAGVLKQ